MRLLPESPDKDINEIEEKTDEKKKILNF